MTNNAEKDSVLLGAGNSALINFSKTAPFIIISAASILVYYLLNMNTPPMCDDLNLQFVFQGWYVEKITAPRVTSLNQIFDGAALYYKIFRGRAIPMFINQLFVVYGKEYFNVINSLIFTGTSFLVYYHGNFRKKANWRLFLTVCAIFWFLTPDLMATVLFMNSSLHESWVIFFILLFLMPYRILASNKSGIKRPFITALFVIPTGFLAGAFNEQSFGLSMGFSILAIIYVLTQKRKVPTWSMIGLTSTICGTLFVLLAPGSKVGLGSNPVSVYINNFPGNVLISFGISIAVSGELILLTVMALLWFTEKSRQKELRSILVSDDRSRYTTSATSTAGNRKMFTLRILFLVMIVGVLLNAIIIPYILPSGSVVQRDLILLLTRFIFSLIISLVLTVIYFSDIKGKVRQMRKMFKRGFKPFVFRNKLIVQFFLSVFMTASIVFAFKMLYDGGKIFLFGLFFYLAFIFARLIYSFGKTANQYSKDKNSQKITQRQSILHKIYDRFPDNKNGMLIPFFFLLTSIASIVLSTALPYQPLRLFFTVFVSFALMFTSVLSEAIDWIWGGKIIYKKAFLNRFLCVAFPLFLSLIIIFDFSKEYRIYHNHYMFYTNKVESIKLDVASGERDIVISRKKDLSPYLMNEGRLTSPVFYYMSITGVGGDPDDVTNKWNAYYLGADTLIGTE